MGGGVSNLVATAEVQHEKEFRWSVVKEQETVRFPPGDFCCGTSSQNCRVNTLGRDFKHFKFFYIFIPHVKMKVLEK